MRILKAALPVVALLASVIGVQAQTVQTVLSYPQGVSGVAVDYVANRTYVLLPNFNPDGTTAIQVLDGSSNAVLATYPAPGSAAIAVNLVTGTVYVAGTVATDTGVQGNVYVLNQKTGAVTATIPVTVATSGVGINAIATDTLHNLLYVANGSDNNITIVSTKTNTVTGTVDLAGQTPNAIAVNLISGKVFATLGSSQIAFYTPKTKALKYITYGSFVTAVTNDPLRNVEYVTDGVFDVPTVAVFSGSGTLKTSAAVGLYPTGVDVDYVTNRIYVANQADGSISVFKGNGDESKFALLNTLAGVDSTSVSVSPLVSKVYVTGATGLTILSE